MKEKTEKLASFIDRQLCGKLGLHHCERLPVIKIKEYRAGALEWSAISVHSYKCRCCGRMFETTGSAGETAWFMD